MLPEVNRNFGELNYYFTQIFTRHDVFEVHLHCFKLYYNLSCLYCRLTGTVEHLLLQCSRWCLECGVLWESRVVSDVPEFIENMLRAKKNWSIVDNFITSIK